MRRENAIIGFKTDFAAEVLIPTVSCVRVIR